MDKKIMSWIKSKKIRNKEMEPLFAYRLLKYVGLLVLIWPLDKNVKRFYRLFYETCWWIFMMNDIFLFLGILIGLYRSFDHSSIFTTVIFNLIELTVICENIFTVVGFKIRGSKIKNLISILEGTVNNVKSKEEILLREYIRQSNLVIHLRWTIYHILFGLYIYLHLFQPNLILPKEVWHPFSIDPVSKHRLVLVQQTIYIFHTGALNIADGIVCMSLNVATVKLQILSEEMGEVVTYFELKQCIREHQDIIGYVNEINTTMRFIILKVIIATAFYLIYGFLQIVHVRETLDVSLMLQFMALACLANYRVYYTASCADDLKTTGERLRFSLNWRGRSQQMSRSMCIIIQRCQKPLCISVCGIMPKFTLKYYGKFSYFTFSYFLTLKAVLESRIRF